MQGIRQSLFVLQYSLCSPSLWFCDYFFSVVWKTHIIFNKCRSEESFEVDHLCAPGSVSGTERDSWLDGSSIHSSLPNPALASTAQRQPAKQLASGKPRDAESEIDNKLNELDSEDEFFSK